jgi:hypothetical protein
MGAPAPNRQALGHMGPRYDLGLANKTQPYQTPALSVVVTCGHTYNHGLQHLKTPRAQFNGGYGRMVVLVRPGAGLHL